VTDAADFVVIGRVRRAHGTRGEICVEPITDFPERFESLREVLIEKPGGERRRVAVESVRWKGEIALVKLAGVDDREKAAGLGGALCGLRREELPPAGEDEYYYFDLVGCRVVDEGDGPVGVVADVLRMPANDVLVVMDGEREVLLPIVKQVIKKVSLEERLIEIECIPGLLD